MNRFTLFVIFLTVPGLVYSCSGRDKPDINHNDANSAGATGKGGKDWKDAGNRLYANNCAMCHGEEGKGDGVAAEFLFPRPRDLSSGRFKIRSTPTGELPTDEDLYRVVTDGIPGSAMPSFNQLTEDERILLVRYIKTLAYYVEDDGSKVSLFEAWGQPDPIEISTPPAKSGKLIAQGATLYREMGCFKCHGDMGKGDGISAPTLVDVWDNPAPPANFTRGIFKGGDSVNDIYMRFTTGMDGSPMPSFADNLSDSERWALAYYVKSLVVSKKPLVHESNIVFYCRKVDVVPRSAYSAEWNRAEAAKLPLMLLWQRSNASNELEVRCVYSEEQVGFLLTWKDSTVDGLRIRHGQFTDAAGLMLPVKSGSPSPIIMGSKENPVYLCQWRFSRQLDISRFRDVESVYWDMEVTDYPHAGSHYPKKSPGYTPVSPATEHDRKFVTGWGVGNPISNPKPKTAALEYNATGPGTLEPQEDNEQDAAGDGMWNDGKWSVVIVLSRRGGAKDAGFGNGSRIPIAFAVWDGSEGDRDGQKSVTFWSTLVIE